MTLLGVVSDTHGLLRPEALEQLRGCDGILHAGDIGKPEVLDALRDIAPLTVVRGNVDRWADALPDTEVLECEGRHIYMLHNLQELDIDPRAAGFAVVVCGHSHMPKVQWRDGVLYLNPGSIGPRRFSLPISMARLRIDRQGLYAELIELPR